VPAGFSRMTAFAFGFLGTEELCRQGTRTKSADRELKTGLIVRLYDDLDDGMAVVLGKLPLGALRRGVRVVNS
jgi:hypothetical protein